VLHGTLHMKSCYVLVAIVLYNNIQDISTHSSYRRQDWVAHITHIWIMSQHCSVVVTFVTFSVASSLGHVASPAARCSARSLMRVRAGRPEFTDEKAHQAPIRSRLVNRYRLRLGVITSLRLLIAPTIHSFTAIDIWRATSRVIIIIIIIITVVQGWAAVASEQCLATPSHSETGLWLCPL
jgi:hypothetical protein